MKDENDKRTLDMVSLASSDKRVHWYKPKPKPKRGNLFDRNVCEEMPDQLPRAAKNYFVPVLFVAKEWNVTPRRIRALLSAKRLVGRRQDNGYWEVAYPYQFIIGTRGPVLKRSQPSKKTTGKPELRAV